MPATRVCMLRCRRAGLMDSTFSDVNGGGNVIASSPRVPRPCRLSAFSVRQPRGSYKEYKG